MYKSVDSKLNFVDREKEILQFWRENDIFNKTIESREGSDTFTFFDGPPTANGKPHIGHVLTRVIKDIIPRYKTMKGYKVLRKAGWDTHGLPVELEVEKKLGMEGKEDIEKYGIEAFTKQCKESVWGYEGLWRDMSEKVGFFVDMDNPYITYENNYIESVWWALKEIWNKDLIYKGHKVVPYCPRCGTTLSSHEVAQGYKDVKDLSAIAKFKVKDKENEYILAWTTTPWTLPSNVSLVVNANEMYCKVKVEDEIYILATELVQKVLGEDVEIIEQFKGRELEYTYYEPLFNYVEEDEKAFFVCCDDYVTLSDGTGVVHSAPAFGEDDARIGRKYNLPFVQLVDEAGKFKDEATDFKGMFVKDADLEIVKFLKINNKLLKSEKYEHSYPFCWRCDTPLLYYGRQSWFIEMTKMRDNLVANNKTVKWHPETIGEGRFGNFLENVVDWSISRERYWGTPLPIWECGCGHKHMVGSREELKNMAIDLDENADIDLHKPFIDNVHLKCEKCSGTMTRVSEVIDVWFDSGSMPFAQWHYPFENKEMFEKNFPANFISEGVDQTRGWFYTLMAISTLLFDKAPYENVIVLGHVQDKEGKKMSKSKGNVVDPNDALKMHGADAVRWYFYSNSSPWLPSRYYDEVVAEGQRKFMGTFWNTYAFYILYANIDKFNPLEHKFEYDKLSTMDKWITSKLNSLVQLVDEGLDEYKLVETSRAMNKFVDELSNWYVRRSRERFWAKGMEQDKINAYMTLYNALITLSKLSAPFVPFMTEEIYKNLSQVDENALESVHLCDYPVANEKYIDEQLEADMEKVLSVVVLGRTAREKAKIKNRQPIGDMYVKIQENIKEDYLNIVKEELNVKNILATEDTSKFTSYSFKPQLKTLGPKYGKIVPKISAFLKEQNGNKFMDALKSGTVTCDIEDTKVELTLDDVLVEVTQVEGFVAETEKDITVVLNTNLTDELIEEGFVREVISKIQTMRKEADFNVMDKITVALSNNDKVMNVVKNNEEAIKEEVLATDIIFNEQFEINKDWEINGEDVKISVKQN